MDLSFLGKFDRIYTYCRVSSPNEAQARSIETQRNRLSQVRPKPDRQYEDVQGGDDLTRPDYTALLAQVQQDCLESRFKVLVVVTEQSRLSRDENLPQLIELFDAIGATLYALDGGKKTTREPQEWLMVSQEALFNQYFLRQHRRTLRSNKAQRRSEGKPINPRPAWGWLWTREKYIVDEEKRARIIEFFFNYLPPTSGGKGWSLDRCAQYATANGFKVSSHGFRAWILNGIHRGHLCGHADGYTREDRLRDRAMKKNGIKPPDRSYKILHYFAHEALITEEQYQAVVARLEENRRYARRGTSNPRYPLSGLVFCGLCNNRMTRHTTIERRYGRRYGNFHCRDFNCPNRRSISERILERQLHATIAAKAESISQALNQSTVETTNPEEIKLKHQIEELQRIYKQAPMEGIRLAIEELEGKLASLAKVEKETPDLTKLIKTFAKPTNFAALNDAEKRIVYHEICDRIVVSPQSVQVILNL